MNIEDYKKKKIEKVKCPSGLEVTINNITPYTLLKILDKLGMSARSEQIYSKSVIDELFKVSLKDPVVGRDIELDDFLREDYIFLHDLIFERVTLPEE